MPAKPDPANEPPLTIDFPGQSRPQKMSTLEPASTVSLLAADSLSIGSSPLTQKPTTDLLRLGRFEIRERLGGGAFGEVFRAYDPNLDREIALKVARTQQLNDPDDLERFFREARAAAQFQHPHIVPVYEVGQEGRSAYLVASLVEGETLADALVKRRFAPDEAVAVVLQLADAVHYAHLKGVFHRDIKPGNVLIDRAGEAFLTDFGLARRVEGEALQTQEGDILGTPAYMSPEQARGDSRLVDARSDLYSLGVVLYELLCGQRPFGGTVFEVLSKVQQDEPPSLWSVRRNIPRDLEAICLKALAKQPSDRYRSVEHFAEDLQRWQQNLPVEARQINPLQRTGKWIRRHPLVTTALALMVAAAASLIVYQQTRPAWIDVRVSPSKNVQVKLGTHSIKLDEQGRGLVAMPPGRYQLEVSAPEHEPQTRDVVLVRGQENAAVVALTLEPRFGFVSLTSVPTGASVVLKDAAGREIARGVTPFHSPRLPTGELQALMEHEFHESQTIRVQVPNGDKTASAPAVTLQRRFQGSATLDFVNLVRQRLSQPAPQRKYRVRSLAQLLVALERDLGIRLVIDEQSRGLIAQPWNSDATFSTNGESIDVLLDRFLGKSFTFVPESGENKDDLSLLITTPEVAYKKLLVVVHNVRDLGGRSQDISTQNLRGLIDNICAKIDPDSWEDRGGPCSIEPELNGDYLSISQRWNNHVKIADYLGLLRQSKVAEGVSDKQQDVATLARSGGKILRNIALPGSPIVHLSLPQIVVSDEQLEGLGPFAEVEVFELFGPKITDRSLMGLQDASFLTMVVLKGTSVRGPGLAALRGKPRLRLLRLDDSPIENDALLHIGKIPNLTLLNLNKSKITDNALLPLRDHPNLNRISLADTSVGDESMTALSSLPRLAVLDLINTPVTDDGISTLARSKSLTSIYLQGTPVSDVGVRHLAEMRQLRDLSLGKNCTNKSLEQLQSLQELNHLSIRNRLIDDSGLGFLKGHSNLVSLVIYGTQFTDACIPHIEAIPNLRELHLTDTKTSPEARAALRVRRPTLRIVNYQTTGPNLFSEIP